MICCHKVATMGSIDDFCSSPGTCGGGYGEIWCNSGEDCGGQICCGRVEGASVQGVDCQPACNQPGSKFIVCKDSSECPNNGPCNPSNYLGTGYAYCG
jgi:hypothetical protein